MMDIDFMQFQNKLAQNNTENNVFARFYDKSVKTDIIKQSGLPEFKTILYIEIRTCDNNDVYDQPADKSYIERFPVEYARYMLAKKQEENGTPLKNFAFLDVEQLESCHYHGIFTIESLAELSDDKALDLDMQNEVKRAKQFLAVNKNNAVINDFVKKEEKYLAEIEKLKAKIAELESK